MIKTIIDAYDKGVLGESVCKLWKLDNKPKNKVLAVWTDFLLLVDSLFEKQVGRL